MPNNKRSSLIPVVLVGVLSACTMDAPHINVTGVPGLQQDGSMERGKVHFKKGRYGLALTEFRAAVAYTPMSIKALNALAATYDQIGRFDLADKFYARALLQVPNSSQTLNNLGYSHMLRGKFDVATAYLREAKRADAMNATVTANLAVASADDVTETDLQAISIEPKDAEKTVAAMPNAVIETVGAEPVAIQGTLIAEVAVAAPEVIAETVIARDPVQVDLRATATENATMTIMAATTAHLETEERDTPRRSDRQIEQVAAPLVIQATAVPAPVPDQRSHEASQTTVITAVGRPIYRSTSQSRIQFVASRQQPAINSASSKVYIVAERSIQPRIQVASESPSTSTILVRGKAQSRKPLFETAKVELTGSMQDATSIRSQLRHEVAVTIAHVPSPAQSKARSPILRTETTEPTETPTFIALSFGPAKILSPALVQPTRTAKSQAVQRKSAPVYEISNGAGRREMAARMQIFLASSGVSVDRLTNAAHFSHQVSSIFFKPGMEVEARALADLLPENVTIVETTNQMADIRLELGGDLLNFDEDLFYSRGI